jgi:hypothetical protein
LFVAGTALLALGVSVVSSSQTPAAATPEMTVYKSPTCGCCGKWIEHLRASGLAVKAVDVEDMAEVKRARGVPGELGSCHTGVVAGYVIEGHVPADSILRLLRDRPAVAGLAVPGMPLGSPGMEHPSGKAQPYSVLSFDRSGKSAVYDRR